MNQQIYNLITEKPRHYAKMVKNQPELWVWVLANSTTQIDNDAAKIYSALTGTNEICKYGNARKFGGVSQGWIGCVKNCVCVNERRGASVSAAKRTRIQADIDKENALRVQTCKQRYGVENVGLTPQAKQQHSDFYKDATNVKNIVAQVQNTLQQRYGVDNAAHIPGVSAQRAQTNISRYGVDNPMKNTVIAERSGENRKNNYDPTLVWEKNFPNFQQLCLSRFGVEALITVDDYKGVASAPLFRFKCIRCEDEFDKRFHYAAPPRCTQCYPSPRNYCSGEERAVVEYIKSIYTDTVITRDRRIINPFELDIVIPKLKIAIEYCGLYWHSEISSGKDYQYHYSKFRMCQDKGYRLITIFSDEWCLRQDIVKRKLSAILGVQDKGIGARQCQLAEVPRAQAEKFHDQYHIQGSPRRLGKNIGLIYRDELVALGSFVIKNGNVELTRFSTSVSVAGAAGKIIKHFNKLYPGTAIVSFADQRWSQGDMYYKLGFVKVAEVPPMQTYVEGYKTRHHKLKFSKQRIQNFNTGLTEWQRMQQLGYDRIWDCGKIKFVLDPQSLP